MSNPFVRRVVHAAPRRPSSGEAAEKATAKSNKAAKVAALIEYGRQLAAWDESSGAPRPVDPRATAKVNSAKSPWRNGGSVGRPSEWATVTLSGTRGAW